jgi:hypothetical protein
MASSSSPPPSLPTPSSIGPQLSHLIDLREYYINQIKTLCETFTSISEDYARFAVLFDIIRKVSLEVIEGVVVWRGVKGTFPLNYKNENYITKMAHDLDFIDRYPDIIKFTGFRMYRNPFIVRHNRLDYTKYFTRMVLEAQVDAPSFLKSNMMADDLTMETVYDGIPGVYETCQSPMPHKKRLHACEAIIIEEEVLHCRYREPFNTKMFVSELIDYINLQAGASSPVASNAGVMGKYKSKKGFDRDDNEKAAEKPPEGVEGNGERGRRPMMRKRASAKDKDLSSGGVSKQGRREVRTLMKIENDLTLFQDAGKVNL